MGKPRNKILPTQLLPPPPPPPLLSPSHCIYIGGGKCAVWWRHGVCVRVRVRVCVGVGVDGGGARARLFTFEGQRVERKGGSKGCVVTTNPRAASTTGIPKSEEKTFFEKRANAVVKFNSATAASEKASEDSQ